MDLKEQFDAACDIVNKVLEERKVLLAELENAQSALALNEGELNRAIRIRDEHQAMISVVPPAPKVAPPSVQLMEDRQKVFATFRHIRNTWIAPNGIAVMAGVDEATTAAILRRAAKLDGMPVEHNGRKGRASKYRWLGKEL